MDNQEYTKNDIVVPDIIDRLMDIYHADAADAADEIERLRAMLDAVDDLHGPTSVEDPRCASCGDWPCPTHLIVCDECREPHRG